MNAELVEAECGKKQIANQEHAVQFSAELKFLKS